MRLFTILLALVLALAAFDAGAARRLGGGGSIGRQSSNVTQRQAAPARSTTQDAAQSTAPAGGGLAAAATPQRRPWGGILGGLAAGLGLAWLANSLGLGPAFGQFLLFLLLAIVLMGLWAAFTRRRMSQASGPGWQGSTADNPLSPRGYNPAKIGNDASARPWESTFGAPVTIGSALDHHGAPDPTWSVPPGFDTAGFLAAAKRNFVTLQDAWDRGDLKGLRSLMTDEMVREVGSQLADRERQPATGLERTEVVMLEAQLLGIEDLATEYMASVEFSGMLREDPSAGPSPFREVWNMTKPKDGSAGWLVAGVQALQ